MSTYPMGGFLPQFAKYIGEFVPDYNSVRYFYSVTAYDRSRSPLTTNPESISAYGPQVLDGDHAISISWSPVIGAAFFVVYKKANQFPTVTDVFYIASATETEILDVGYPCATRNSFLNPGNSPLFMAVGVSPPVVNPCDDPTYVDPCAEPAPLKKEEIDYGL